MAKPTPEQAFEMKSRKLVKEIWEKGLNRSKDELTLISLGRPGFIEIKTGNRDTEIHTSLFEDYFNATNNKAKEASIQRIKDYLRPL
jgi:hypothetical protein